MDAVYVQQLIGELKLSKVCYEILCFLIKTRKQYEEFMSLFWNEARQFFSVAEYRSYRIEKRNLTLQEFNDIFLINRKKAFEELFQHQITDLDMELFDTNESVNAEYVFYEHKKNKNMQFARLVL
jgi:hypothetical protein